ncbi:MAG: DUF4301 family protein [Thermodesulfobacteriota bacterium]
MTENGAEERWSEADRQSIAAQGLTIEEVGRQLALFRRGVPSVRLNRPCVAGDGIVVIPESERPSLLAACEEARRTHRLMKFVPASGAASRMFREWYRCFAAGGFADEAARTAFAGVLKRYAFFPDLRATITAAGEDLESLIGKGEDAAILKSVLTEEGLNYGCLPKALLKFHAYPEGSRTALEEHLVEAALYARDAENVSRVHFTVSREHESAVRTLLSRIIRDYESRLDTVFAVGISTQDPATDTIAVDPENRPFRDERGKPVFRPGGHGSLLRNLNLLDEEIIFLKNIDNTVPDRLKTETSLWKKLLAGCLIRLQQEIFASVRLLAGGGGTEEELERIRDFAEKRVNIGFSTGFRELSVAERRSFLFRKLNRPLRVCGMVKNEGEPGGGPFWVEDADGRGGASRASLQIIEESQIDRNDPKQRAVWSSATHFNPVDLVCGVRDFDGRKFDLPAFIDPATVAITRKSEKGRELLALERPGLWNGSMAFWNTVFVEVPIATFNPVKTVTDLLRPQHLPFGRTP